MKERDFFCDKDVYLILVSPLRRTMQTAMNIFTNHKSNQKFVINEYMRERIISSCDIPQTFHVQQDFLNFKSIIIEDKYLQKYKF